MTTPTPGTQVPIAEDKLDEDKIDGQKDKVVEKVDDDNADAASEEYEPVVTPKTWVVVGVRRDCLRAAVTV